MLGAFCFSGACSSRTSLKRVSCAKSMSSKIGYSQSPNSITAARSSTMILLQVMFKEVLVYIPSVTSLRYVSLIYDSLYADQGNYGVIQLVFNHLCIVLTVICLSFGMCR